MSKLQLPSVPTSGLFKQGMQSHHSEDGVLWRNTRAVRDIAQVVRTSMGPCGRTKIVVNNLGKVFLTSDVTTILNELDIVHPAVKVVVMASTQQHAEMGDASNLVVVLAGELLAQAEELARLGMSPAEITDGFEIAKNVAKDVIIKLSKQHPDSDSQAALRSVIAPKQYGSEKLLAKLVAEAVGDVTPNFNVDNVRVVKVLGSSLASSFVVNGMVFPFPAEGSITELSEGGKVAIFTAPVDVSQTEAKGTVLLHNANELLQFSKGEEEQMDRLFAEFAKQGVRCVVAGAGVGTLAVHFLNKHGILVLKVGSKFDLQRVSRVCGARMLPALRTPQPEELGEVGRVKRMVIGGDTVTTFEQVEGTASKTRTIVLRGATQNQLEDVERAVDDGVAAVKALARSAVLVPGAGATEMAVAKAVYAQGERTAGTAQHAVKAYARAFEAVPRTLAENAGLDATAVLANIYAINSDTAGVDVDGSAENGVVDAAMSEIYDIAAAKLNAIELATEAASTVLQVDQIIVAKRAGGPALPKQGGDWDQD